MSIYFIILTLVFILFLGLIFIFKEYRKSLSIFFIIVTTIVYTPSFYYVLLNGTNYKSFSNETLDKFMLLGTLILLELIILIVFKNCRLLTLKIEINEGQNYKIFKSYMYLLIGINLVYVLLFFNRFPLLKVFYSGNFNELERPDVYGGIPLYYTFSTFFNYIIPSFYFIIRDSVSNKDKKKERFFLILTIFFLIVGGNKSTLVFFMLFIFIFDYKYKINLKLVILMIICIFSYALFKGIDEFNGETIKYMLTSPFDRFFVTQGAGLINRIEMFDRSMFDTIFNANVIKAQVYEYIYGVSGGKHPTYFIGDFIVKYGYICANLLHFIILVILFFIAKIVDHNFKYNNFIIWNFFSISYMLGIAELSKESSLRIFAIFINIAIYLCLNKRRVYLSK